MKKTIKINPIGLKGKEINERMKSLMGISTINENKSNVVVELTKVGPDGKAYAIVRENHEWYIKTTDKKQGLVAEDFKYIGGLQNKKSEAYPSYAKAIKHLNLKFKSLAEAYNFQGEINVFENDNLLSESGAIAGFSNYGGNGFSGQGNLEGNTSLTEEEEEVETEEEVELTEVFVDNETNISEWVGRGFLHQDFGFTEEETIQRAKEEEQFNDERFNKFKEFEQPVDIIYKALMKRVEKFLYKAKQMNDVFGPKSNKEIIEILQRPILINNLQRLSYLVIMIYDGYTGEHQPKIFNIENKLWSKLVGTDSDKLTPDTFKMPFDTMVVRFDNHKHYFYTKFGSTFGKENTTGIDCILREFVVTSNGSGDFCFYFPFQSAKVDMKEHVGDNDEFGITYKALNSDNKEIKVDINALSIYNDFFMIQIPFNPKDLLFGATYKGRLIDKTMSNAVSVFLKMNNPFSQLPSILVWNLCKFHEKCDRFQLPITFFMKFYMNFHEILHRFSPKFIKIHQTIETCSKLFQVFPL